MKRFTLGGRRRDPLRSPYSLATRIRTYLLADPDLRNRVDAYGLENPEGFDADARVDLTLAVHDGRLLRVQITLEEEPWTPPPQK